MRASTSCFSSGVSRRFHLYRVWLCVLDSQRISNRMSILSILLCVLPACFPSALPLGLELSGLSSLTLESFARAVEEAQRT
jgi:hypothetical protein